MGAQTFFVLREFHSWWKPHFVVLKAFHNWNVCSKIRKPYGSKKSICISSLENDMRCKKSDISSLENDMRCQKPTFHLSKMTWNVRNWFSQHLMDFFLLGHNKFFSIVKWSFSIVFLSTWCFVCIFRCRFWTLFNCLLPPQLTQPHPPLLWKVICTTYIMHRFMFFLRIIVTTSITHVLSIAFVLHDIQHSALQLAASRQHIYNDARLWFEPAHHIRTDYDAHLGFPITGNVM